MKKIYLIILIIFLIGILIRSIPPLISSNLYPMDINHLITDSLEYHVIARNFLENHYLDTFRPPGFPFILTIFYLFFGYNLIFPISFLIIISSFLGIMGYLISVELFKDKTVGLLSLILIIMNPLLIEQAPHLLSDTLAVCFFSIIIFFSLKDYKLFKMKYSILIGILIGITILIRPNYIYLSIIYLLFLLIKPNLKFNIKFKKIALFLIGVLIIIGPWVSYTYNQTGELTISGNSGANFFIGNNPNATGRYVNPLSVSNMTGEELIKGKEPYTRGLNYLYKNPHSALILYTKKAFISVFQPYQISYGIITRGLIFNILFIMIEIFGIIGLISFINNRELFYYFLSIILAIYLTLVIFTIDQRYILPLIFIFIIFGSYYIVKLYKTSLRNKN